MKIWKISRIPVLKQEDIRVRNNVSAFKNIMILLGNTGANQRVSIEVCFMHEKTDEIELFMIVRGMIPENIAQSINNSLNMMGYISTEVSADEVKNLMSKLNNFSSSEVLALRKSEFIATVAASYYAPNGFFYWSNPIETDEEKLISNQSSLLYTLLSCENSYVMFQFLPVFITENSKMIYSEMAKFLSTSRENNENMQMYLPATDEVEKTYSYYRSRSNLPFFHFNIIVGGTDFDRCSISDQVKSYIQTQTKNNPSFDDLIINTTAISMEDESYPYKINELIINNNRLKSQIWNMNNAPTPLYDMPILMSIDETASCFKFPYDDGMISGIRGTHFSESNNVVKDEVKDENNIIFGQSMDSNHISIGAAPGSLAKHMIIVGMPGTGKTRFSMNLLLQLAEKEIPFLVIEPIKTEYRTLIDEIPDLQVFSPGNSAVSPFFINPFMPPEGVKVESYKSSLIEAFSVAINGFSEAPLNDIFIDAIRECYIKYGWRDNSKLGDKGTTPFGMLEFIDVFREKMESKTDYKSEVGKNIKEAGVTRLKTILVDNPMIFDTVNNIPTEDLLSKPTVIELNAIHSTEQKSLIISLLLIRVRSYISSGMLRGGDLKGVLMLDEAHAFLRTNINSSKRENMSAKLLYDIAAETRANGFGLIIADQKPTVIGGNIFSNTDIKISFRLTEKSERDAIIACANFDENAEQLFPELQDGEAFVFYNKMSNPKLIETPNIFAYKTIKKTLADGELTERLSYWQSNQELLKPFSLCSFCKNVNGCNAMLRSDAEFIAGKFWIDKKDSIADKTINGIFYPTEIVLCAIINSIKNSIPSYISEEYKAREDELLVCAKIAFIRKAMLEKNISIDEKNLSLLLK